MQTERRPKPPASHRIEHVRVLAWNVGHRAGIYPAITSELVEALRLLDQDIVLLTEFYDDGREDRHWFRDRLCDIGYVHCDQSGAERKHNRVLIASRKPFRIGDITGPGYPTSHARTNFLHVCLEHSEIELIGLRRPSYRGSQRQVYWESVNRILSSSNDRALAVAGDFNENLFKKVPWSTASTSFPHAERYTVTRPDGDWSYTNPTGSVQTPIDHVIHTSRVHVRDPRYIYGVGDIVLAAPGPLKKASLSDHAPLAFTVELNVAKSADSQCFPDPKTA